MTLLLKSSSTTNSANREDGRYPARRDGHRQADRHRGGNPRADVGNEPQGRGQDPPQDGVGHADQVKPDADRNAESGIDEKQHREVSADPRGGVFQHLRGHGQLTFSHQPDESIAQVLAADQEEDHENDDDAGHAQPLDQCAEGSTQDLQWARRRGKYADRVRPLGSPLRRLGLFRLREILANVLGGSCYLAQRGDEIVIHRMEFRLNVVLVLGHFGGQVGHLNHCRPYRHAQHREAQRLP